MLSTDDSELKDARKCALAGVGRNVLEFQRLEILLKHLVKKSELSVSLGTKRADLEQLQDAKVEKKTLGILNGDLFEQFLKTSIDEIRIDEKQRGTSFSTQFKITDKEHAEWQDRLKRLIEERNQLVHTSLLAMDLQSIEGCRAMSQRLEEQRPRIREAIEWAFSWCKSLAAAQKQFAEVLMSPGVIDALYYGRNPFPENCGGPAPSPINQGAPRRGGV